MKKLLLLSLLLTLLFVTGCKKCENVYNKTLQAELFITCLEQVPEGPTTVKYNDWDEVVRACNVSARGISTNWVCYQY